MKKNTKYEDIHQGDHIKSSTRITSLKLLFTKKHRIIIR